MKDKDVQEVIRQTWYDFKSDIKRNAHLWETDNIITIHVVLRELKRKTNFSALTYVGLHL